MGCGRGVSLLTPAEKKAAQLWARGRKPVQLIEIAIEKRDERSRVDLCIDGLDRRAKRSGWIGARRSSVQVARSGQ
jgi:hypothetical protein